MFAKRVVECLSRTTFAARLAVVIVALVCSGCAYFDSSDVKRGDQHLAAGKWEEATLAYRQALKEAPFDTSLQEK